MPIIRESDSDSASEMDDLYPKEDTESSSQEEKPDKKEVEPHTELISSKLIMGKSVKPGDKIVLEVVKTYGDEVEVRYGTEKKSEMSEDEELSALAE